MPVLILCTYVLGVFLLGLLEHFGTVRILKARRSTKQFLFNDPMAFEEQRHAFLLFFTWFILAWCLIYWKVLPTKATYDTVFGPVMITGCWWFIHLFRNTHRHLGWEKSRKLLVALILLWALANIVDLALIKLGAWNFSKNTTLGIVPFPFFLEKDVLGNTIQVPYIEVLGFNLFISWFILFVQMFINDLIKSPSSWKKLFATRRHFRAATIVDKPGGTGSEPITAIYRAAEAYDTRAMEEALDKLFRGMEQGLSLDEKDIQGILDALRKKRMFFNMQRACEVFFKYDFILPVVLRQMAQALIDQGSPHSAPFYLNQIDLGLMEGTREWKESKGLMGRTYKQCYVDLGQKSQRAEQYLLAAVEQYRSVYLRDKSEYWHGINFIACAARGQRDGLKDKAFTWDWKKPAQEILISLTGKALDPMADPWILATGMEACIALDNSVEALKWAQRYVTCPNSSIDLFELASTYRQLVEVWQLDREPPYAEVLDTLREAILEKPGGKISFGKKDLLGHSGIVLIAGLERASKGLVRLEKKDGSPVGSGFLVSGHSLGEKWEEHRVLFITADHVLGESGSPLPFEDAFLNFFVGGARGRLAKKLWHSSELDVAVFTLRDSGDPERLSVCSILDQIPQLTPNKSPVYILGYPLGLELQVNCSNNYFVGSTASYIRYKSQTWPGSSGSPVLDENWRVIGVHTEASIGEDTNQGVNFSALVEAMNRKS